MSDKPPPKDKKNKLNAQDQAIWDAYMRDPQADNKDEQSFADLLDGVEVSPKNIESLPETIIDILPLNKSHNFETPSQLDRRTKEKLQKGKIKIEARLDLHGLTRATAYPALKTFIERSHRERLRCVLVITGKGKPRISTDDILVPEEGVLKKSVPMWLGEKDFQKYVISHTSAKPKDGGSGALYVYLRRHKNG